MRWFLLTDWLGAAKVVFDGGDHGRMIRFTQMREGRMLWESDHRE